MKTPKWLQQLKEQRKIKEQERLNRSFTPSRNSTS